MKNINDNRITDILNIVSKYHFIKDREAELKSKNYVVAEKCMGPGGTGNIKYLKDKIYIQVGYGHGKYNYAKCVILKKQTLKELRKIKMMKIVKQNENES